jgi:peptidoglycan hydrolase CwlO-like protein
MIMTQQLDKKFDIGEDINLGIVNNVKRNMENMITKLQNKNSEEIKSVKAEIKDVKAEITQVKAEITSVKEDIKILIALISEKQSS